MNDAGHEAPVQAQPAVFGSSVARLVALSTIALLGACSGSGDGPPASGPENVSDELDVAATSTTAVTLDLNSSGERPAVSFAVQNLGPQDPWALEVTADAAWISIAGAPAAGLSSGQAVTVTAEVDGDAVVALGEGVHDAELDFRRAQVDTGPTEGVRMLVRVTVEETTPESGRLTDGLVALYEFEEAGGTLVRDTSGQGVPLDLDLETPGAVVWLPGSLSLNGDATIASPGSATKVVNACGASNEITLEAWITPTIASQSGPARIISLSGGSTERNVTLGHGDGTGGALDGLDARLRTTTTTPNGTPSLTSSAGSVDPALQHVAYTRRTDGLATIYVDGAAVSSTTVTGDLSGWDSSFRLALGNEVGASRPWSGTLHLVAIYERALDATEVAQNFAAGSGDVEAGSLAITPLNDFSVFGITGSDLAGESMTYEVANPGTEAVDWSVSASESWVLFTGPTSGSLAPGASASVTLGLDGPQIAALPAGQYSADVSWTNVTNGFGNATTSVDLTLSDPGGGGGQKPGPHNTGPSDPSLLVPSGTITADVDGMVIENVDVNGIIRIEADNVTIRNFRINAGGNSYGIHCTFGTYTGTVMEDGEIHNVDSSALIGRNFTARRLNIHHSGGDGIKAEGNVLVEGCWIHHLGMNPGAHADGNQTRNGSNIVFRGNNIDMPEGLTGFRTNAAFIIQDETGPVSNFLIEGNWLNGGNYTIMLANEQYGGPSNITILNNRFGRDYRYGTLTLDGLSVVASGNVWDDTGAPMSWNTQ